MGTLVKPAVGIYDAVANIADGVGAKRRSVRESQHKQKYMVDTAEIFPTSGDESGGDGKKENRRSFIAGKRLRMPREIYPVGSFGKRIAAYSRRDAEARYLLVTCRFGRHLDEVLLKYTNINDGTGFKTCLMLTPEYVLLVNAKTSYAIWESPIGYVRSFSVQKESDSKVYLRVKLLHKVGSVPLGPRIFAPGIDRSERETNILMNVLAAEVDRLAMKDGVHYIMPSAWSNDGPYRGNSKEGGRFGKGGQFEMLAKASFVDRYFILSGNCLFYYKHVADDVPTGVVWLSQPCLCVRRVDESDHASKNAFEIYLEDKVDTFSTAKKVVSAKFRRDGSAIVGHHARVL